MKLSEIISSYRQKMGLSQREFARRCGLSHGTIPILEKGYNPQTGKVVVPDVPTYQKLADGMRMPLQELLDMIDQTELISLGTTMTDTDRLEALHQNRKLCLLFDRQRKMSDEDIDKMIQLADWITKENYGD